LRHEEYERSLSKGDQFLSFGERNAFALVLFMYESISKNVDLVVLDDPISSFDRNKKFALIEMLFMRERSLKDRTVLMTVPPPFLPV
jgi:wobble nucleotide-excising tRNase